MDRVVPSDSSYLVYLRIKPIDVDNVDSRIKSDLFSITDGSITTTHTNKKNETIECRYDFAQVLEPSTSQDDVFNLIVSPRLKSFFQGTESLVFSYGTSNSGKSFTLHGTGASPGIIPRTLYSLFASIDKAIDKDCKIIPTKSCQAECVEDEAPILDQKLAIFEKLSNGPAADLLNASLSGCSSHSISRMLEDTPTLPSWIEKDDVCSVWISFYEIYNEKIYDLLGFDVQGKQKPLNLGHDKEDDSYYPIGLLQLPAFSWEEAYDLYRFGKKNLHIASTFLNRKSSRSHCIFTIKVLLRPSHEESAFHTVKSFIICDLAGTERMVHTDGMGDNIVREMNNINTSLLVLNRCFVTLKESQSQKKKLIPPYRESKLTMILKKFLLGSGKLSMISNISQDVDTFYQTQQVLKMTSVAHATRVQSKHTEFMLRQMPGRRFSMLYGGRGDAQTPVGAIKPGRQHENGVSPDKPRSEMRELLKKNYDLTTDLEAAREQISAMEIQIRELNEELDAKNRELKNNSNAMFDLQIKHRDARRVAVTNELKIMGLDGERTRLRGLMNVLKKKFDIDFDCPEAIVERVGYLFDDLKIAAKEEIAENDSQWMEMVEAKDNEIAELKGQLIDLKYKLEMSEKHLESSAKKVRPEKKERAEVEEENESSSSNESIFVTRSVRKTMDEKTWYSEEDSLPPPPPKAKTTVRKKKKKRVFTEVPSFSSQSAITSVETYPARRTRRQLLEKAMDHLGDGLLLDKTQVDYQMSPQTIMTKTLSTRKKRTK